MIRKLTHPSPAAYSRQSGEIWLWRYEINTRHYPGWHLTANQDGVHSLIRLLAALESEGSGHFRTVNISMPSETILSVPNNRNATWAAPAKLRISLAEDPNEWVLADASGIVTISIGVIWLGHLRVAIDKISAGQGDFSIGPAVASQRLWIWWCNV